MIQKTEIWRSHGKHESNVQRKKRGDGEIIEAARWGSKICKTEIFRWWNKAGMVHYGGKSHENELIRQQQYYLHGI